ncbi:MAG TPA: universal stress protein [Micromonosporaceae bacterium]
MNPGPILVGYDGSPHADAAIEWAFDEAARTGRPVELVHAFQWPITPAMVATPEYYPYEAVREQAEKMVADATAKLAKAHPDVAVSGLMLDGPPAAVLEERSREAALVVLGNRGHGGFAQLLLGSTGVAVSAHAHCPVVIVRGEARVDRPVVVGVDGSLESLLALRYAFEQAAGRKVPLRVLRAWNMSEPLWSSEDDEPRDVVEAEQEALDELLAMWRDEYPEVSVAAEVVFDRPSPLLVKASEDAQLMVVGSRGRGGFKGLLLGSVSQQLLHHSHCPVAVIREASRTSADAD